MTNPFEGFTVINISEGIGNIVLCDLCNKDYTFSNDIGGFIFGSNGVCPSCAPKMLKSVIKYDEEHAIRSHCPHDMSHKQFIYDYREGIVHPYPPIPLEQE